MGVQEAPVSGLHYSQVSSIKKFAALWGRACNIAIRARLGARSCNHTFHKTRVVASIKKLAHYYLNR